MTTATDANAHAPLPTRSPGLAEAQHDLAAAAAWLGDTGAPLPTYVQMQRTITRAESALEAERCALVRSFGRAHGVEPIRGRYTYFVTIELVRRAAGDGRQVTYTLHAELDDAEAL